MSTIEAFGQQLTEQEFLAKAKEAQDAKKKSADKKKRRRYKLHGLIKHFCEIKPKSRLILITQEIYDTCATDQRAALDSLRDDFHYNLQLMI
jgi:hypothetical protein